MNKIISKLISGLFNLRTLTVVMFVILSVLIMNDMLPNDNAVFYIVICMTISLYYVYNVLINDILIKQDISL